MTDAAERDQPENVVCHAYKADEECDILDKKQWYKSNPGLGVFRSEKDLEEQLKEASRLPSKEAGARNLLLNQRVAQEKLWLAPAVWKLNNGTPDDKVFVDKGVSVGLDLSKRNDLTVAIISAKDEDGIIHVGTHAFTPLGGIVERSARDRVPYDQWARDGILTAVPGDAIDYEWVAQWLKVNIEDKGIAINNVNFDRWRIEEMRNAAGRVGFAQLAIWNEVGQGYQSMSPRIEAMEVELLKGSIRHGSHPVLNLGAQSAIVVADPAGNRKLDKLKSSQKIDGIIAMLMSIYSLINEEEQVDISSLIG